MTMRRLAAVLLAGSVVALVRAGTPEACPIDIDYIEPPTATVGGAYESPFGTVYLQQTGAQISGSFDCCGGGSIDGRMVGNVVSYTWRQANGAWGRGTWVASEGRLMGNWGWEGSDYDGGPWDLSPRAVLALKLR
jgi:hypothetical protein